MQLIALTQCIATHCLESSHCLFAFEPTVKLLLAGFLDLVQNIYVRSVSLSSLIWEKISIELHIDAKLFCRSF